MMPLLRPPPGINDGNVPTSAADLARHLCGRKSGRQWIACCPAHNDRDPSLSIGQGDDGRILIHCHAGCGQRDVIDALRARGLWRNGDASHDRLITPARKWRAGAGTGTAALVTRIWNESRDPRGTIAQEYLASRALDLPPELAGTVLRFHQRCPWQGGFAPCLIAPFRAIVSNEISGIHRIRLDQPERWPRVERKMLGTVVGSAVKFDAATDCLAVGEGIETCLAARQFGLRPTWALGSAGGIGTLAPVDGVKELCILGENDNGANGKAAAACRQNWTRQRVLLLLPAGGCGDFNDLLLLERRK